MTFLEKRDLLFNPPYIKKEKSPLGEIFLLPAKAKDLLLSNAFLLLRDPLDNLRVLREDFSTDTSKSHRANASSVIGARGNLLVWGDQNGWTVRDFMTSRSPLSFLGGSGLKPLALHPGRERLYLVEARSSEGLLFSSADLKERGADPWREEAFYPGKMSSLFFDNLSLQRNEERSLLFIDNPGLVALFDSYGFSTLPFHRKKEGLLLSPSGRPLLAPGGPNAFFVLRQKASPSPSLQFYQKREEALLPETVFQLDGGEQILDLVTLEDKGIVLTRRNLFLFSQDGLEKKIPLRSLKKSYNRLLFAGSQKEALLWKEGGEWVQKIKLN